jgi:predicted RNA-binding Zn-ribbon protein involved in translation (DUF1610 family)
MEKNNTTNELENQSNAAIVESAELKFRCPLCGGNELVSVGMWATKIRFFMDGKIEWGEKWLYDDEGYFCCDDCGYELQDAEGCRISDYAELIRWLFERQAEEVIKKHGGADPHRQPASGTWDWLHFQ